MGSFREPAFNLACGDWHDPEWGGAIPPAGAAPRTFDCQLRWPGNGGVMSAGSIGPGAMLLLLPKGTDIRPSGGLGAGATLGDLVEVPAGTGRFYVAFVVDDVAKGFTNEHRYAVLLPQLSPIPIP